MLLFLSDHRNGLLPFNFPIPVYSWANITIKSAINPEERI